MKQIAKRCLYLVAPRWATALLSARARAHSQRVVKGWGCGPVNRKLVATLGSCVQEGPFAGMTLTDMTHAEQLGPYLLGVYESELDEAWSLVLTGSYTQIVDIGAKFGYYAVGLARKFPSARVVAFDTDWWARKAMREMSAANKTSNVEVLSYCDSDWLSTHIREAALVISDCEGYEAELFDQNSILKLRSATLIIETHDCLVPGVCDRLRAEFEESHSVRVFTSNSHRREPSNPLDFLSEAERGLAIYEARSAQTWLLCLPKQGPNQGLHMTPSPG